MKIFRQATGSLWAKKITLVCGIAIVFAIPVALPCQQGSALLEQVVAAFSPHPVTSIRMTGIASWHSGGSTDSGSATLLASVDGSSQIQLSLASKGLWIESQSAVSPTMICGWQGNDGVQHSGNLVNCIRPTIWFFPSMLLQSLNSRQAISAIDLGLGPVGETGTYRHLNLAFSTFPNQVLEITGAANPVDLGFDPNTLLPAVLAYDVLPDSGGDVLIPIEVHFSNYNLVDGVQVPFLIQRYVNGSLQLEIQVSSAQVN